MKIVVDFAKCTGLGVCESFAPDVFEVDDSGELVLHSEVVPNGLLDVIEQAVRGCPTEALRLEP